MPEYVLQSRWVLEDKRLVYYGLRKKENMFKNEVRLNGKQLACVRSLPKELTDGELKILGRLIGEQIVLKTEARRVPSSVSEARFCTECAANDFIIPGLEFEEDGRCPMCATAEQTRDLKSVVPIVTDIPKSKRSRFDVAVFYTGGKDSTFLLYQLAKLRGLRVLALTWEIPFTSDSARKSIENAKKHFPTVEFISRRVNDEVLKRIYRKLYSLSGNTCACPSLAYLLFFPELVASRVPYFIVGNEPVQMLELYYNHIAPRLAYSFADNKPLSMLINIGRVLTLRPPLGRGQLQTLLTMKQLAYGDHPFKKLSGYASPLVTNVVEAIHSAPELLPPLKKSIRASSRSGNIPAFVHLDFDALSGGVYDWSAVKETLVKECGWVAPSETDKALHTSCKIERCKDHSQFVRFYSCKSKIIPFSAIEISLASRRCGKTREQMIAETESHLGFSLDEPHECKLMREFMGDEV